MMPLKHKFAKQAPAMKRSQDAFAAGWWACYQGWDRRRAPRKRRAEWLRGYRAAEGDGAGD